MGFRGDLLQISINPATTARFFLRDREPPDEESEAQKAMRAWRAAERKTMVESIEGLIGQAQNKALSRYTRSAQRARWIRLAGQLIWQKDQILRNMTLEALEQDVKKMLRDVLEDKARRSRTSLVGTWASTLYKKKDGDLASNASSKPEPKPET